MRVVLPILFITFVCSMFLPTSVFASDLNTRIISYFFPDTPEMLEVARCESGMRQMDGSGRVLRGGLGGQMVGLFQLYEKYHRQPARAQGFDIDTLIGNVAYARALHRTEGLTPWNSSRFCWQKVESPTITMTEPTPETQEKGIVSTLRFGAKGAEVMLLQEHLTQAGFASEIEGATRGVFDIPTYLALIRFQCERGIACLRGGPTKGLGTTDEATRDALSNLARSTG